MNMIMQSDNTIILILFVFYWQSLQKNVVARESGVLLCKDARQ